MRIRTFFIPLFLIALTGVGSWYFLYSQILANATAANDAATKRQTDVITEAQDQSLAAFLATSSSTAATLLGSVVPAEGSVPFITMIESLAKSAGIGLKVQSVSIASPAVVAPNAKASNFNALTLSLSVQGSWNSLSVFLAMLETLPYKTRLDNISFSQSVFSVPGAGAPGKPQSFWSGLISLSVLKVISPEDSL